MKTYSTPGLKFCAALLSILCLSSWAAAQQRPLLTEDVDVLEPGALRIQVGIDFFQDAKFPVSGLTGDLTRVGVIGINVGLSPNVEFQIRGVAQNFLSINRRSANPAVPPQLDPTTNSLNDTGDFTLATKIKLRNETRRGPSLGFRFGVELPNSNETRGIGLNQTNAFGTVLVGKRFGPDGRLNTFGNLGIGILTAPTRLFTQNDVLLYGLAGLYRVNDDVNLAAEVNGRANLRGGGAPLGTESLSEFRLGVQVRAAGLRFDAAGIKGLTEFSPRSGVTFGVTYDTPPVFAPVK
ncbi:MAG TPA: hypothetical protein VEY09_07800 [Pyrinomonadaceae bacterium]|nr:hypothetical protein [Pyrinomonadaceae bacterium]